MPQVIISLPNAIFPFFAHLLNVQGHEEDVIHTQAQPREVRSPRRAHSRQSQHRRQPQSQTTPRHRSTRHPSLRHRRPQRSGQDTTNYNAIQTENIIQQVEMTHLPDPRKKSNDEEIEVDEGSSSVHTHVPSLTLDSAKEEGGGEEREKGEAEEHQGENDLATGEGEGEEETESANEETQDDDTSTYGDSDSEQFLISPHDETHESDHDGDEESERGRRRRRRGGRAGGSERGGERVDEAGGGSEGARGGEREAGEGGTATAQIPAAAGGGGGREEEREVTGGEGRGFIGNGWWFLALLLMVQLYQSGGFLFLCMLALYVGFNSSAMLTYRSRSWKYRLTFLSATTIILLGTITFIYWKFKEERLWMYLVFIPSSFQYNVTSALWTVWVNEFIVVFLTIVGKHYLIIICASFRIFGQSTKKKILAIMEQASKLYRCTIPIPVWIFYLYHAFGEETEIVKIRGLLFSVNIRFLGLELAKIIEHKTPEEMCHRATTDDIKKYTEDCAICREDLSTRSPLTLPCSHVFCTECIYQWFDKHPSCPTCRSKIGTEDMFEESSGNTNIHLQENGIGLSVSFDDL